MRGVVPIAVDAMIHMGLMTLKEIAMTHKITLGTHQHREHRERINIRFELNFEAFKRHEKAIRILKPGFDPKMMTGSDSFRLDYRFVVDYHGVVENLNAIVELCDDPDVVNGLSCQALESERILIHEVLKKLDATIEKVGQGNRDET